jgi:hypothetical protein
MGASKPLHPKNPVGKKRDGQESYQTVAREILNNINKQN